ncbi:winged helix-turn-helix domain-containing protein [Pedobacter sp.]
MFNRLNLIFANRKYVFALVSLLFVAAVGITLASSGNDDFDLARREVLLRRVGHQILLQSGDSTSRVLPVQKIAADEYQISFEHQFSFQPDLMMDIASKTLANDPMSKSYVVNVLKHGTDNVIYGFAISANKKDDIISCNGRKQPSANYVVNVKFKSESVIAKKETCLLGGLPLLAFVSLIFFGSAKNRKPNAKVEGTSLFTLGKVLFDAKNRKLNINGEQVDLTATETRLLLIFASSPNMVIERNRLQKEIWEDEGVIVGRSLDMFISKLRKKLEPDPNVNIVVVRGKGYKLEV